MRSPESMSPLLMPSCSFFFFWLFSPWLEELYNVFPLSFSVAGRAGKTWWGPRQTVNGLDFQWSSWSADRCLTWEEIGDAASWGQEPASSSEEISIDGGRSNSLDWNSVPALPCPSPRTSPAHIAFRPYLVPLFCLFPQWTLSVPLLWWISSCALWTIISPLGQEDTWEAWGVAEATWLDYKSHAFWEFNRLFILIFKFNYKL